MPVRQACVNKRGKYYLPMKSTNIFLKVNNSAISWLRKFAIVRGFVGALSILTLLASILGIQVAEFGRVVFAIFTVWQSITSVFANIVSSFPFIPVISSYQVNALVFCSVVSVPGTMGLFDIFTYGQEKKLKRQLMSVALPYISFVGPFLAFTLFLNPNAIAETTLTSIESAVLATSFIGIPLIGAFIMRGFRIGALYLVGSLLAVQLLYYAPVVGEGLEVWTDQILSQDS